MSFKNRRITESDDAGDSLPSSLQQDKNFNKNSMIVKERNTGSKGSMEMESTLHSELYNEQSINNVAGTEVTFFGSIGNDLSNNEELIPACKHCKKELSWVDCPSIKCPLKKHKPQGEERNSWLYKNICVLGKERCFCLSIDISKKYDLIAECYGCQSLYHLCPVPGCCIAVDIRKNLESYISYDLKNFEEHLKSHNNRITSSPSEELHINIPAKEKYNSQQSFEKRLPQKETIPVLPSSIFLPRWVLDRIEVLKSSKTRAQEYITLDLNGKWVY